MRLKICTWNINSIRLREKQVCKLLEQHAPDILCLQEIKTPIDFLPTKPFIEMGFPHIVARGQKGYNGVAVISRLPINADWSHQFCSQIDARHLAVSIHGGIVVENFYVPAGGDIPDISVNPKFAHKLNFLDEMAEYFQNNIPKKTVLVGDLNVAPREDDVWSHKQLLRVVSHTPVEVEKLNLLKKKGGFVDITRKHLPDGKLYSWWSYRSPNWENSDRGRRLDHIWASQEMASCSVNSFVFKEARRWNKPSDHVPVFAEFEIKI